MSKVLVTGGSGFIGSHIIDALLEKGHTPIIYDLESPIYDQPCEYVKGDILDLPELLKATNGVDIIYNLAAEANVNIFYENPLKSNQVTSHGVLHVLEAAKINEVKRVILASTEWIYGSTEGDEDEWITEETPYAQNPDHLYTSSKIAAELFVKNYYRLYEVHYTIVRFGIPFGERARAATVTPIFINKILNDETITVHGDGSQTRQFIYVKDLAAGNVACLSEKAENEIFNINGTKKISVLEIIKTLEKKLNKTARINFEEDRPGNFKGRFISSEKAKNILGWEYKYTYEDAMQGYVEWWLERDGH
ncbi:MAG: NAD-dependent epimerase/dehydratase family protein [Bacteroidetes bacterium]|nr:NAD-dependent epimerase/dehydratase family protein [Bacteroidota bacterium]